jgi:hypothetical protein
MGPNPHLPQDQTDRTPAGELKLPIISAEREDTLKIMHARIDAFAGHLYEAHKIFCEPQNRDQTSRQAKAAIFTAKQHVKGALLELESTLYLVDLNPEQVSHIARHLHRAKQQLSRIEGLTDLVLRATRNTHHAKALAVLAQACPRASHELESSLVNPLERALSTPYDTEKGPPPPALTS